MPAKKPAGARNETVRCEKCGEYYAVTYKRCPFCEDDEPTMIFRRPKARELEEEQPPRRRREEPEEDAYSVTPLRGTHRSASEEPDEYEELLNRRRPVQPEAAPPKQAQPRQAPPPRRAPRDEEEEEYEEPRRRTRRREDDEDDDQEPRRRGRSKREDDYYEDEDDDDYDDYDDPRSRRGDGGKRLVTNARGGGYRHRGPSPMQVIGAILSIALVVAAIYIVYLIVKPLFGKGEPDPVPPPSQSVTVSPSLSPSGGEDEPGDVVIPSNTPDPTSQPPDLGDNTPPPVVTTIPSGQTATGFSLNNQWGTAVQDITLDSANPSTTLKVVFTPAGSTGTITWHSSKSNIVTVDESGKLTAVAQGVATITVSMAGGYTRECMVRSNVGGTPAAQPSTTPSTAPSTAPSVSPSASPSASPSTGGALSMNVGLGLDGKTYDFSLKIGESWSLKVKNASGAVSWSVKDSSVVTVDANGKVSGVAKGNTTVTASVDGQTLECIVRVS